MAESVNLSTGNNSNTTSGSIKWSGLGSGVDFNELIDKLIVEENKGIARQEIWKKSWQDKIGSINGLDSRMVALKLNAKDLNTLSGFMSKKSSSSNQGVVNIVNTSSAINGSHNIVVGTDIPSKTISKSFKEGQFVGGNIGDELIIEMNGKKLVLTASLTPGLIPGLNTYDPNGTLEDLNKSINDAALAANFLINSSVNYDKTRGADDYQRLIILGLEGGEINQVKVTNDPTDLGLNSKNFDDVVYKTWLSSCPRVEVSGDYLGSTNKSFTFMAEDSGTLGQNDITIKWADDKNNSGSFIIKASEWSATKEYEVFQGLKLKFDNSPSGTIIQNQSFTVDTHHYEYQRAQNEGLAQTERVVHQGFSDLISPINTGKSAIFKFSYSGVIHEVTVRDGATLQDLITSINGDPKNPGIKASFINDGMGSSNSYRLALEGMDSGAERSIEILDAGPKNISSPAFAHDNYDWVQRASDSLIRVDGFPNGPGDWIHRPTNQVGDVIDGVVLELNGSGKSTITVQNDVQEMVGRVEQFVQSINFVISYISEQTKWIATNISTSISGGQISTPSEDKSGLMIGNYGFQMAQSGLRNAISQGQSGLSGLENLFTNLAQIGISTTAESNGEYVVEKSKLTKALTEDAQAVANLFISNDFTQDDGTVVTHKGIAEKLYKTMDDLTDDETGITKILVKNYNGIIRDINLKVEREERRIEMVRKRLETQYARLEKVFSDLNAQSSKLESALSQLPSKK